MRDAMPELMAPRVTIPHPRYDSYTVGKQIKICRYHPEQRDPDITMQSRE